MATIGTVNVDLSPYYEKPVKNVLFLAPGLAYANTVVRNLADRLNKRGIPFTSSNLNPYEAPYLCTKHVSIGFECSDPVTWTPNTFYEINCVFGKKELLEIFHKQHAARTRVPTYNGSLENYIITIESGETAFPNTIPKTSYLPEISKVHFNPPMTIVLWEDGTKTMVKCQEDDAYSDEVGLALCIAKKALGNKGNFNNVFRKWVPEVDDSCEPIPTLKDIFDRVRNALTTMSFDIYKEEN